MNNPNEAILLTEDGHPIGDIVIAGGDRSVDTTPSSELEKAEANREYLRHVASEMTGDPSDTAVAEIFEGIGNEEKRREAMKLFVNEHCSIRTISDKLSVPERTIAAWMFDGKWAEIAAKDAAIRRSASVLELESLRSSRRTEVARAQLDAAKKIREKALEKLDSDEVSVKSAAEALKSAADVEARILGVSESGAVMGVDGSDNRKDGKADGKKPLVVIFNGGLPPRRQQ